jgi:hypothetical protein
MNIADLFMNYICFTFIIHILLCAFILHSFMIVWKIKHIIKSKLMVLMQNKVIFLGKA